VRFCGCQCELSTDPSNLGSKSLKEIMDYVSETSSTGPLAFYKEYYPVHNDQLCAYAANNQGYLPILNQSIPENKMTKISAGDFVQFKWDYSAWHTPSNNFVFITEYPAGKYKSNPSWNDLHFVCGVTADSSGAWQCKLPNFNGDSKQVIVTIWQRVDSAGENFISCADVKVENSTVVPPENIWSVIGDQTPWTSALEEQPKAGDIVTFNLEGTKKDSGGKSLLATYSLSISPINLSQWDSILAAKINNDSTHANIMAIGQLNAAQGKVIFNETDKNSNYVYLNKTISDPLLIYSYSFTTVKDPNPIIMGWQQIGQPLNIWVNSSKIKINDQLKFALQLAGIEQTLNAVTVNKVEDAPELIANQVNSHQFIGVKVAVGVLQKSGSQSSVQFNAGGDNRVYVYRSSDDATNISYVIRNLTQPIYSIYPAGIGSYKAGSLVQNEEGQVYICVEAGWCNLKAYSLSTEAWMTINPKPAPAGYLTYPDGRPYKYNSVAADIEGNLYKCTQAAWCNDQSGVYAPGLGRAWYSAWEKQ
jgi:predicted carbohydrate-binding protein with CBM5 and CBM33 domain